MTYQLRDYQHAAVNLMRADQNYQKSVVHLPTGSGKSLVIAAFVDSIQPSKVLILQPSKEILSQNKQKLLNYVDRSAVGVYSASFSKKQVKKYTLATIQSVYKKGALFTDFEVVLIDEAHLYKNQGMFDQFIKKVWPVKVFGLSATPYRLVTEKKWDKTRRGTDVITRLKMLTQVGFDDIIYSVNTHELTPYYLAPITYETDVSVPVRFSLPSDSKLIDDFELQLSAYETKIANLVKQAAKKHQHVLVFTTSVKTAQRLAQSHQKLTSAYVSGDTSKKERDRLLSQFQSGEIQVMYNCEVLTTGFDFPELDCIVLARPTKSLILYNQILGRGTRQAVGKENCTVYDVTGTVDYMGGLEEIRVHRDQQKLWTVSTKKRGSMRDKIMRFYKVKR